MFTSIQLQIILDPSLYSFCILWFINSICYRWRNEYRKRKNFYWRESAIGFVLFTGINAPLIVFQEEKQVQLVIFIDGSLLIKNECLFIATGCNWLPSREGAGGVLKPVNKTSLVTGLFAVCFSWRISKGSISLDFSPISYRFLSRRNVAEAKREKQLVNRQLKQTANEHVIV